jgi:hypothetical protein
MMCTCAYGDPAHMMYAPVGLCVVGSPVVFGSNGHMIIQWGPTSMGMLVVERGSGLKEFFKYFTGRVLDRDPFGFEARPSILRTERPVRNRLVAKVDFDRHVAENGRLTLGTPEHATLDQVG